MGKKIVILSKEINDYNKDQLNSIFYTDGEIPIELKIKTNIGDFSIVLETIGNSKVYKKQEIDDFERVTPSDIKYLYKNDEELNRDIKEEKIIIEEYNFLKYYIFTELNRKFSLDETSNNISELKELENDEIIEFIKEIIK